jgi:hypothetical protein
MPNSQSAVNYHEYRGVPVTALTSAISSILRDRTLFELNSPQCVSMHPPTRCRGWSCWAVSEAQQQNCSSVKARCEFEGSHAYLSA